MTIDERGMRFNSTGYAADRERFTADVATIKTTGIHDMGGGRSIQTSDISRGTCDTSDLMDMGEFCPACGRHVSESEDVRGECTSC